MSWRKCTKVSLMAGVVGILVISSLKKGRAVPSFERQTGMSCSACHTVFPELTPFGRIFKMHGYVFSKSSQRKFPPVAGMVQASFTNARGLHNGVAPFDDPKDSETDKVNLPQQASVFYGGKIIDNIGGFVQVTYDGVGNDVLVDLTDIRYGNDTSVWGTNLIYGLTLNNAPTVEDVWNSSPIWGFPYAASAVAPTPAAGAIVDGALASQVGGIGAYGFWNNLIYGGVAVYRTTRDGITRPLGAGTETDTVVDDAAPYWRLALQHQYKRHSFSVGTYGIIADIYPGGMDSGPTDQFTDIAFDAQYQYIADKHIFSVQSTWIREKQDWDASFALGLTANGSDTLKTWRINANYFYGSHFGDIGGSVGYFSTTGDRDTVLYAPNPVDGSRKGRPNSNGFVVEADYVFREKYKLSLQYTIYDKFNGAHSNYDGHGRDASDNNTFYALAWLMF